MQLQYQLKRSSRSRGIRISISARGILQVSAAPWINSREIDKFVEKQQDWIAKTLAKNAERKHVETAETVEVFGKTYQKKICSENSAGVVVKGDEVCITPISTTQTSIKNSLERYLKTCAAAYILPRVQTLSTKMDINYSSVGFREQSTRWGSCSTRGHLSLNWRLVHFAPLVIDYVLIHELAHRKQMNHSSRFWQIVETYDPEYKKHQGVLKRAGWGE